MEGNNRRDLEGITVTFQQLVIENCCFRRKNIQSFGDGRNGPSPPYPLAPSLHGRSLCWGVVVVTHRSACCLRKELGTFVSKGSTYT